MDAKNSHRNSLLDGLRGLAALMVALGHSFITINNTSLVNSVVYGLVNGGVAVSIFFLLSGFVLGKSLERDTSTLNSTKILRFYIKRLFRIYPIFLLQILLLVIFLRAVPYQHFSAASSWYDYWFNFPITVKEILSNLFFRSTSLGGVTWTLKAEIIGSIFLPFFFFLSRKTNKYIDLGVVLLIIICSYMFRVSREASYLYVFYMGLTLPKWKDDFHRMRVSKYWADTIAVLLLSLSLLIASTKLDVLHPFVRHVPLVILLGILIYIPTQLASKILNSKLFQFIGKVSYSFYLFHFLVLYILMGSALRFVNNQLLQQNFFLVECFVALTSILVSLGISHYLYRFIELPGISWGRKISHKLVIQ